MSRPRSDRAFPEWAFRRKMAVAALAALLLATMPVAAAEPKPESASEQRPNVLFLIADDLNCDLGCYGHPRVESPNIDALAERGIRFQHAYCQYPLCSPSRTSFLTGLRPDSSGVHTNPGRSTDGAYGGSPHFREYHPDLVTLPQAFRQQGYFAARVGKLYHYGVPGQIGTAGLDDPPSWETTVNPIGRDKKEEDKIFSLVPGSFGGTLSWLAAEGTDAEQTDAIGADAAIELLQKQDGERPFFIAVGFYRPHTPYVAPKAYFEKYPRETIQLPELSQDDFDRVPGPAYQSAKKEQEGMSDELRQEAIQAYWASISFMDAQVGRVLAALEEQGLADDTIVVMTSDHGYHMYDHGLWQKMSVFENSARVPLIVALPDGKNAGSVAPGVAELVDLYPTLTDLCGFEAPDHVQGSSLVPTLNDPQTRVDQYAFTQVHRGQLRGYSVRTERFRYTWWNNPETAQLYDYETDPHEMNNVAGDGAYAEIEAELRKVAIAQRKESPKKQAAGADGS